MANTTVYPFGTGGELPSDIGIINDLTTGGVNKALSAEMGKQLGLTAAAVGRAASSETAVSLTWVQGTVDWDSGQNVSSTTSLRSGFITIDDGHMFHVQTATGYFIKGVLAYNSASLSDYYGVVYKGNASGTMDKTKTSFDTYPNGKVLRVVVGRTDDGTIATSEGSNVTAKDVWEGIGDKTIVEHIVDIEDAIDTINSIPSGAEHIVPSVDATYIATDGSLVGQTSTYKTTALLDVEAGDVFTYIGYTGSLAICCAGYTSAGTFVQALLGSGNYDENVQTITIPSGTIAKVRFCGRIDTHPLEIYKIAGSTITAREAIINLMGKVDYNAGRRLYVIGDSITAGSVASGTAPEKPFPVLVSEALGMTLTNYGIGGSTIGVADGDGGMYASLADLQAATKVAGEYYTVLTGNQTYQVYYWDGSTLSTSTRKLRNPIARRYAFMGDDADVVIVAAGTNDFQYNWTNVGTMEDRTIDTFYGALHVTCLGLLAKFFKKPIIFMTPIKRAQTVTDSDADTDAHKGGSYGNVDSENLFGLTLGDYAEIIKEVCRYYSIPVIDMYSNSILNPSLSSQSSLFDNWKTHPFQEGHDIMARYIVGQVRAIIGT